MVSLNLQPAPFRAIVHRIGSGSTGEPITDSATATTSRSIREVAAEQSSILKKPTNNANGQVNHTHRRDHSDACLPNRIVRRERSDEAKLCNGL